MLPVHHFMGQVLASVLRKAPLSAEKVAFAWRMAVGPAVDRVTTVEWRDRTLHVRVRDAAWGREVERSAAAVKARLESILGPGTIRWIEVEVLPHA
jgi:hypothetical protein